LATRSESTIKKSRKFMSFVSRGLFGTTVLHLHLAAAMTPMTAVEALPTPQRQEHPQLQQAQAKLAQLEQLLKQGRTHLQMLRMQVDEAKKERDDLRGRLDQAAAERDDLVEKHEQMAFLLNEARADRDRVADNLHTAESQRTSLAEKLEDATGGLDQLRAAADRALALAREIVEVHAPAAPSDAAYTPDFE
jgi:septal ring factor EnvC (AmiA/AmiB activator)